MSKNMDDQFQLTLGDKINWPFILGNMILKFQDAIVKVEGEQSEQEVREAALCLYNAIPKSWHDDGFKEDRKEAITYQIIDNRNLWCERRIGAKIFKGKDTNQIKEEKLDPYRLFNACVNLLDRRGLISKKNIAEVSDGNKFDPNKLQEIMTE